MTRYFAQNTPRAGLEHMMMSVPGFQKRGGGMMILSRFCYKPEDVDCRYCLHYRRRSCQVRTCPYTALTVEQGVRFLESHILPHQNRSILKNRADEIAMQFQSVLAKNNRQGIRTQAEKKEVASAWLELAISCAKVPVKYEADEIKRRQKEEKTQRETEPVMA